MVAKYRAENIGSLLRPPQLLEARTKFYDGQIDLAELRAEENQAVLACIDLQRDAGIDVFTDGEYRRRDFRTSFADSVDGFVEILNPIDWIGPNPGEVDPTPGWYVGAKLKQHRRLTGHESGFLLKHAPAHFKITIPSPGFMAGRSFRPGITEEFYPSQSELLQTLSAIVIDEINALAREGVRYVQLDAPGYAVFMDPRHRRRMMDAGVDLEKSLSEAIDADNACLEGVAPGHMTLAMHVCRGNNQSHWHSEGGYEPIAEMLFEKLNVDTFLLEYDSSRAGGFEPLRFLPKDKTVVLSLVTTKTGVLESADDLMGQIEEASKYAPIENLAISPQCGFATVSQGNSLTWDEQKRKLELVGDIARKVWG